MYLESGSIPLRGQPIETAIIGPEYMVQKTLGLAGRFPSLRLKGYPYVDSYKESTEILKAIHNEAEVVLFTGPIPYHYVLNEIHPSVPTLHVPYTTGWLYPGLTKIRESHDITRITIDAFPRFLVEEAYEEMGLPVERVLTKEYPGIVSKEELLDFHLGNYRKGKSTAALTSLRAAYVDLQRSGVPSAYAVPTASVIAETLEKVHLIGEAQRSKETQIVVGIIAIDDDGKLLRFSPYEAQRIRLAIQQNLLRYAEQIDGSLIPSGGNEHLFFTTRGLFTKSTNWCTAAPLVSEVKQTFDVTISIGVGMGITANQAANHARIALEKAREAGGNACYVLLENKQLFGPLGSDHATNYSLRHLEPEFIRLAEQTGMSSAALSRLLACHSNLGQDCFTAHELAPVLGVTVRSTHRLLIQLVAAGHARVVGEEKLATRGRPRQVFQLLILKGGSEQQKTGATPDPNPGSEGPNPESKED